jgi:hypothetical protein
VQTVPVDPVPHYYLQITVAAPVHEATLAPADFLKVGCSKPVEFSLADKEILLWMGPHKKQ